MRTQYGEESISIQTIEKKSGDAFVIRLEVSPQSDKAAIEHQANELYKIKLQLKLSEKLHQARLQDKDELIVLYQEQLRQSNTNLIEIVKTMAEKEPTNKTTIHATNIGFVQSGSGTVSNFSQNIGHNINEITRLIGSLREIAQGFPKSEREEVLVNLEDLQEDISIPEKQKPERIKIRLGRLLVIAGTIAGIVAGSADFSNNVLELAEKLGVPIEISQPQLLQQLPALKLNQQDEIDLASQGINKAQAEILRSHLATFADDWDSAEMSIYDNYDAAKTNL